MNEYRVDVSAIVEITGESVAVNDSIELPELIVGSETFTAREPIRFDVELTNTGAGIVGRGRVVYPVTATCARCLIEFPLDISADVEGFYVEPGHEEGIPEEQEVEFISTYSTVDILPSLMEALVLEAPYVPLHDPDCAGLCLECGANLNESTCACGDEAGVEHPFAKLAGLLEDTQEK